MFKVLSPGDAVLPCYQEIKCHLIFDIKIEDFRRKTTLVALGNLTGTPEAMTYASVVSYKSVRVALTISALNDLEVKTADIENAYLTSPMSENIWTILGPEFVTDQGKRAIVVHALYGLKSDGASFRNHLAECMQHLGWTSCISDRYVWHKTETRLSGGNDYYVYVLGYVNDILVVHQYGTEPLRGIDKFFRMKK